MKKMISALFVIAAGLSTSVFAADYVIDTKGAHASINFKASHLGYSYIVGRFNTFDGTFSYDKDAPHKAKIQVNIDTNSIDSNHAARDKHLRSDDYLNVKAHPKASFVSTAVTPNGDGLLVKGNLSLHGVTKPIVIDVSKVGEGQDPWGGYRVGFVGKTQIDAADFGLPDKVGTIEFDLHVEGKRQ